MKKSLAILTLGFLGWVLSACSHSGTLQTQAPALDLAIVFVPGYKGSEIKRQDTGKTLWITASKALYDHEILTLNLPEYGLENPHRLMVGKMVDYIPVIPGISGLDPYRGFLRFLQNEFPHGHILPFAYDWRQDNVQTAGALAETIDGLKRAGYKRVLLISHSMGGLIAAYYLRYGSQDPERAVENWAGLNQDGKSEPSPVDLLDPEIWRKNSWGLLQGLNPDNPTYSMRLAYLKNNLQRARAFSEKIHAPLVQNPTRSLPTLNIRGNGFPTQTRALDHAGQLIFWRKYLPEDLKPLPFAFVEPGDWGIPYASTPLPQAFASGLQVREMISLETHGNLFNDPLVRKDIEESIR